MQYISSIKSVSPHISHNSGHCSYLSCHIFFSFQALLVYNYIVFLVPYTQKLRFPDWSHLLGWFLAGSPIVLCFIAGFIHAVCKAEGPCLQVIHTTLSGYNWLIKFCVKCRSLIVVWLWVSSFLNNMLE